MTISTNDIFVTQFSDEIKAAFQQKESKLLELVRTHRNVVGSTYKFPRLDKMTANTKSRNAEVTGLEPVHDFKTATLADAYAPMYLDKLDEAKTNASLRQEYVNGTVAAINRKIDQVIIAALDTDGGTAMTTTAGKWTYARHLEALQKLMAADAFEDDRAIVLDPFSFIQMLNETKVISGDYTSLMPVQTGQIGNLFGMKVITSNLLTISTSETPDQTDCWMFNKSAVGVAVGQDPVTEINYVPTRVAHLVNTMVSLGAVVIETAGVVAFGCDIS